MVPPCTQHGYIETESLDVLHILLHPHFLELFEDQLRSMPGFLSLFYIEPGIRFKNTTKLFLHLKDQELEQLHQLCKIMLQTPGNNNGDVQRNGLALYVLALISNWYVWTDASSKSCAAVSNYNPLIRSAEYIQINFDKKLSLDELAQRCNLSRTNYIRMFRELFQCTPGEYIINYRVEQAKKPLQSSDLSITEVALRCGFYDGSHLVRFFTRNEGISPRQYRYASKTAMTAS